MFQSQHEPNLEELSSHWLFSFENQKNAPNRFQTIYSDVEFLSRMFCGIWKLRGMYLLLTDQIHSLV